MDAFWTPFPPARTGTADYAAALVRLLSPRRRIAVVVADDAFGPATAEAAEAAGARALAASAYAEIAREVSLDVYFLANNPHHVYLLRRAERHPGAVVLHESSIEYAYRLLARAESAPGTDWKARFAADVRAAFPDHPHVLGDHQLVISSYVASMASRFVTGARGTIVHNPVLAERLSLETGAEVAFVPHPPLPPLPADAVARAWRRLAPRLPDRPVLFAAPGFASFYKRLPAVLAGYARFAAEHPAAAERTALVVAGDADEDTRAEVARAQRRLDPGRGRWTTLPYLAEDELQALLEHAALVVNLRYPTSGEASGMVTRALEAGRTTLVSDHGFGGSLPDDVVVKIPVGEGEVEALAAAMARCAAGERLLDEARVRAFAARTFDAATVAARFDGALERIRERKVPAV